jgi:polyribonucleotide nucleotidyltransferase
MKQKTFYIEEDVLKKIEEMKEITNKKLGYNDIVQFAIDSLEKNESIKKRKERKVRTYFLEKNIEAKLYKLAEENNVKLYDILKYAINKMYSNKDEIL